MYNGIFPRHNGGVELNMSSSRKYAFTLRQFLSKVGAFHWPPKTTILWVLGYRMQCVTICISESEGYPILEAGGPRL